MIRRARRDGREARGNKEREKTEERKGAIVSSSPQGMSDQGWCPYIYIYVYMFVVQKKF